MKPAKKIPAIILTAMMIVSLLSAASALGVSAASGDKPNPSGDYLKFTVNIKKSEAGLAYNFVTFKTINYMMEEGDKVEYDVWISMEENGWGFIDSQGIKDVNGDNFRDSGGADDNGVGIHPGQDMSEYAFGQWYHRVIEIPDAFWGKEMPVFQVSTHATSDELEYSGYSMYDNIFITNNGAIKLIIFRDASDWDGKTSLGPVKDSSSVLECLTFTDEDMAAFAAAEEAKAAEQASKEASKAEAEASKEASREAASIEASIKQSEEDAAAAAAEGESAAAEESASKDDEKESSNLILIICIAGGGVLLVVVIILIAVGGKKKEKK